MHKLPFIYLTFYFSCICCNPSNQSDEIDGHLKMDTAYFEIDFDAKNIQTSYSKDIIDTAIYLQLETTSESEFSEITQLEVTGKYYILLDKEANGIFFFHKNGSYAKKISPSNTDVPIPFERVLRFTIDPYMGILSFNDIHTDNIYQFDLEGNFIDIRKKTERDYYRDDFALFQGYELSLNLFNHDNKRGGESRI